MTESIMQSIDDTEGAHSSIREYGHRRGDLEDGEVLDSPRARHRGRHSTMDTSTPPHYSPPPTRSEPAEQHRRHQSRRERLEYNFEETRKELDFRMRELNWLRSTGSGWQYSTENVEVGDMVHVPWPVFCKDRNVIVTNDHYWLPAHGGYVLVKHRWGLVYKKDKRGNLYMWLTYTFSNTEMADKRREMVEDEETGERGHALQDYMHVVTTDEGNKDEPIRSEPLCFEKGMQFHCKSINGYRAPSSRWTSHVSTRTGLRCR